MLPSSSNVVSSLAPSLSAAAPPPGPYLPHHNHNHNHNHNNAITVAAPPPPPPPSYFGHMTYPGMSFPHPYYGMSYPSPHYPSQYNNPYLTYFQRQDGYGYPGGPPHPQPAAHHAIQHNHAHAQQQQQHNNTINHNNPMYASHLHVPSGLSHPQSVGVVGLPGGSPPPSGPAHASHSLPHMMPMHMQHMQHAPPQTYVYQQPASIASFKRAVASPSVDSPSSSSVVDADAVASAAIAAMAAVNKKSKHSHTRRRTTIRKHIDSSNSTRVHVTLSCESCSDQEVISCDEQDAPAIAATATKGKRKKSINNKRKRADIDAGVENDDDEQVDNESLMIRRVAPSLKSLSAMCDVSFSALYPPVFATQSHAKSATLSQSAPDNSIDVTALPSSSSPLYFSSSSSMSTYLAVLSVASKEWSWPNNTQHMIKATQQENWNEISCEKCNTIFPIFNTDTSSTADITFSSDYSSLHDHCVSVFNAHVAACSGQRADVPAITGLAPCCQRAAQLAVMEQQPLQQPCAKSYCAPSTSLSVATQMDDERSDADIIAAEKAEDATRRAERAKRQAQGMSSYVDPISTAEIAADSLLKRLSISPHIVAELHSSPSAAPFLHRVTKPTAQQQSQNNKHQATATSNSQKTTSSSSSQSPSPSVTTSTSVSVSSFAAPSPKFNSFGNQIFSPIRVPLPPGWNPDFEAYRCYFCSETYPVFSKKGGDPPSRAKTRHRQRTTILQHQTRCKFNPAARRVEDKIEKNDKKETQQSQEQLPFKYEESSANSHSISPSTTSSGSGWFPSALGNMSMDVLNHSYMLPASTSQPQISVPSGDNCIAGINQSALSALLTASATTLAASSLGTSSSTSTHSSFINDKSPADFIKQNISEQSISIASDNTSSSIPSKSASAKDSTLNLLDNNAAIAIANFNHNTTN